MAYPSHHPTHTDNIGALNSVFNLLVIFGLLGFGILSTYFLH